MGENLAQPSLLVEVEGSSRRRVAPASIFAVSIYRTGMPLLADLDTKKNDSNRSRLYLVPEAGLTRSTLRMLLGVAPRRRVAPAPKLLAQFVELGCRFSLTSTPKKTTPIGAVYNMVPEAGLEPARF